MKMTTDSGYEIVVTPFLETAASKEYPEHLFIANAFNPDLNTSCWGHGETEILALRDCIASIKAGHIFDADGCKFGEGWDRKDQQSIADLAAK